MIWQLAREQLRSQKRFVAWTAVLLTLAMALASYAAITATTQISNELHAQRVAGFDDEFHGYATSWIGADQATANQVSGSAPIDEVDAQIEAAIAAGSDIQARRDTNVFLFPAEAPADAVDLSADMDLMYRSALVAITGDFDWDSVLVEGTAPAQGQVALSSRVADALGVTIGESVPAYQQTYSDDGAPLQGEKSGDYTVSGITGTAAAGRNYDVWLPEAYASWEDSEALIISASVTSANTGTPVATAASWNDDAGEPMTSLVIEPDSYYGADAGGSSSFGIAIAVSVALLIGLIAMAFAVGRSQAQARTTWAATARAMGARRSSIAAATILETLVIGAASSAIGIVVGWCAVVADLALIRSSTPDAFLPSAPVVVWWVMLGVFVVGLVFAGIVGAVPAFWASRVSPVAALKPVTPIVEAEVSRRVSVRGIVALWVICCVALWFTSDHSEFDDVAAIFSVLLSIAAAVLSFVLVLEVLRRAMPALGHRLSHSTRLWAMAAGDSIAARPRQSAIPALILTILAFGGVGFATFAVIDDWLYRAIWNEPFVDGLIGFSYGVEPVVALVFFGVAAGIAVLIALAIFASGSQAFRADDATRGALGMTVADARKARAAHFGLPLTIGVALGSLCGFALGVVINLHGDKGDEIGRLPGWPWAAITSTIIPNLGVIVTALAMICVGSAMAAATTSRRSPVSQLAHR